MKVHENLYPELILEEVASDGSTVTNPPADHRKLFLGEDGLFHLRDSAGTITTPGAASLDALLASSSGEDIADALAGAAAPTAGNPFATMADAVGGGASWVLGANEDGTSFANFTSIAGTWSSNGTHFLQTNTASSTMSAYFNTKLPLGLASIVEVEMRFPSVGQPAGLIYAAVISGLNSASAAGGPSVVLNRSGGNIRTQDWGLTDHRVITTTVNADTWYKIRMITSGYRMSIYKDGTLLGSANSAVQIISDYVGLGSYAALAHFRNFKAWTLSGGVPA